jgi:hypothetical protein
MSSLNNEIVIVYLTMYYQNANGNLHKNTKEQHGVLTMSDVLLLN